MTVMTQSSNVMAQRPSANIPQFCNAQNNWMGYNGTQTAVMKLSEMNDGSVKLGNKIYETRRQWFQDMKCRLYAIKLQNDLIPSKIDEEPSKESSDEIAEIVDEDGLTEELALTEMKLREEEEELQQIEADIANEEHTRLLQGVARSPEEMHQALSTFTAVVRGSLISMGAAYTSYLDGSQHTSLSKLDAYNAQHATVGADPTFCTDHLRHALEEYNAARTALEQYRVQNDSLCMSNDSGSDVQHLDDAEPARSMTKEQKLLHRAHEARTFVNQCRIQYNEKAMANAQ